MEGKINEAFQNDTYLSYYDHKKAMAKVDDLPGVAKHKGITFNAHSKS